jgi:hypothetical protein
MHGCAQGLALRFHLFWRPMKANKFRMRHIAQNAAYFGIMPQATRMNWSKILGLSTGLAMVMSACEPPISLPPEPRLLNLELTTAGNLGLLTLDFEDGDGNFGLDQTDTTGVFCTSCPFHHNIFCEYEELRDGQWTPIELDPALDQVPFYYRAPRIEPTGQNKTLRGTITVELAPRYYLLTAWDTLRFAVHIVDRDLQSSDTLRTSAVLKP